MKNQNNDTTLTICILLLIIMAIFLFMFILHDLGVSPFLYTSFSVVSLTIIIFIMIKIKWI